MKTLAGHKIQQAERDLMVQRILEGKGGPYNRRFHDWMINHGDMWVEFRTAADKVWDANIREYSPYVIVNVLRYRANIRGIKFSMTNTLIPDLARLYNAVRHPLFKTSTRFGKETM